MDLFAPHFFAPSNNCARVFPLNILDFVAVHESVAGTSRPSLRCTANDAIGNSR
jgi:hypothetical protein